MNRHQHNNMRDAIKREPRRVSLRECYQCESSSFLGLRMLRAGLYRHKPPLCSCTHWALQRTSGASQLFYHHHARVPNAWIEWQCMFPPVRRLDSLLISRSTSFLIIKSVCVSDVMFHYNHLISLSVQLFLEGAQKNKVHLPVFFLACVIVWWFIWRRVSSAMLHCYIATFLRSYINHAMSSDKLAQPVLFNKVSLYEFAMLH